MEMVDIFVLAVFYHADYNHIDVLANLIRSHEKKSSFQRQSKHDDRINTRPYIADMLFIN